MRMKGYFEQVASGGGAFGFFYGGEGGVAAGSDVGWNMEHALYVLRFLSFFFSLCRQVKSLESQIRRRLFAFTVIPLHYSSIILPFDSTYVCNIMCVSVCVLN